MVSVRFPELLRSNSGIVTGSSSKRFGFRELKNEENLERKCILQKNFISLGTN